jgi:ketosteroid isomerase-like protein
MSDNTRRVEESLRAMERGDVHAVAQNAHPDIEFVNPPNALEPGTRHGVEGFKTGLRNLLDAFEDLRFESERIIDLGDRVVALGTWTGRGRGSSYAFEPLPYAFLVTLKDGLTIRYEWFAEHDEALRAAGLPPGAAPNEPR